jgi:hypothetical protein
MKITKELPQFKEEKSLLIVASRFETDFYLAYQGKINKIKDFKFTRPTYSDREGFFASKGSGKIYGSGSVYEPKKERIRQEFKREFEKNIKEVLNDDEIDDLYIFCPSYIKNEIKRTLKEAVQRKAKSFFEGDFNNEHPFALLKKIKIKKGKAVFPIAKEAWQILKKFKK